MFLSLSVYGTNKNHFALLSVFYWDTSKALGVHKSFIFKSCSK